MSEEQVNSENLEIDDSGTSEDFEEISSEEVDRIVSSLDELMNSTQSENIKAHLEDAQNEIFYLVYDESDVDEEEEGEGEAVVDAA